jgi:hypothetical protein
MQANEDVVQKLVLTSLPLKLGEGLEVGLVDITIVVGGEGTSVRMPVRRSSMRVSPGTESVNRTRYRQKEMAHTTVSTSANPALRKGMKNSGKEGPSSRWFANLTPF